MRCEQVEKQLNRLMDQRRAWTDDPVLAAHCASCPPCRQIAEACAMVDAAFANDQAVPELSRDFSARVLAEMTRTMESLPRLRLVSKPDGDLVPSAETRTRTRIYSTWKRSRWSRLLVAAVLFMAALPAVLKITTDFAPSPTSPGNAAVEVASQSPWQLQEGLAQFLDEDRRLSEELWRNTGRGIAELPHQVRRAATLSETAPLTGAIRPVAVAWQALWQVFPVESVADEPATGETSFRAGISTGPLVS